VYLDPGILLGNPLLSATSGVVGVPADVKTTSYSAYMHGNYRFTDQWELTAGLRFTHDKKKADFAQISTPDDVAAATALATALLGPVLGPVLGPQMPGALLGSPNITYSGDRTDNDVSPMVGVNFRLNEDVLYYAKYSRGSQSGGFNTDFFPYLPSIEFEDETVDAFEIGVKSMLAGGTLQLNADVFLQKYKDLQVFQRIESQPSGTVVALTNAGKSTSQGMEFEGIWLPVDQLQLTINGTYLDATYDKFENVPVPGQPSNYNGNYLNFAPEWKLYAGAQYTLPVAAHDLVFNLDYSYQDDSWSGPNQADERYHIDSFDLWNARVTFNPAGGRWQLAAWWNNIADQEYYTNRSPASITNIDRVVWGMPRLWGVTVSYFMGK
jgi:iron complex outermembrane receptor protein